MTVSNSFGLALISLVPVDLSCSSAFRQAMREAEAGLMGAGPMHASEHGASAAVRGGALLGVGDAVMAFPHQICPMARLKQFRLRVCGSSS